MVGRSEEYGPTARDYLGGLEKSLATQSYVTGTAIVTSLKVGAASADLRYQEGERVTVDHYGRQLAVETTDTRATVSKIKEYWGAMSNPKPKLQDRMEKKAN